MQNQDLADKASIVPKADNSFKRNDELPDHVETVNSKIKPYECNLCRKSFSLKSNLKQHNILIHIGGHPFKCKFCGKGLISRYKLDNHIRTHTKEKPFKCEECGEGFAVKAALKAHQIIGEYLLWDNSN